MVTEEQIQALARSLQQRASVKLGRFRWTFLVRGLLALALAVAALVWPQLTMSLLIKLVAGWYLIESLSSLFVAWRSERKFSHMVSALWSAGLGVVLLVWTNISVRVFLILVGIWLVVHGGSCFLSSRKLGTAEPERGPFMTLGLVLLLVGIVLIAWPETGIVAVSWLISACSAIVGSLLLFLSSKFHQVRSALLRVGQRSLPEPQ